MSSKQKVIGGTVGITLLLLIGGFVVAWASDSSIRKAASLQEQLLNADELSREEFNALKLNLMRTVDTMPREKVREMYGVLNEERREQDQQNMDDFFAAASVAEKEILLDRVIDEKQRSREIQRAMRTDGAFMRRKPTKEDKERMEKAREIKEAMDAGEITEEQAREQWMALRENRGGRGGANLSDAERAEREASRQRQQEFNEALAARAEKTGADWQPDRGRGRGRGQVGGRPARGRGGDRAGGNGAGKDRGRTRGTQS